MWTNAEELVNILILHFISFLVIFPVEAIVRLLKQGNKDKDKVWIHSGATAIKIVGISKITDIFGKMK